MTARDDRDLPARTLVTSYCFPPYSDTAAVVAAKRVREMGEPVDVVYNAMDSVRRTDASLLQLCGDQVRRFRAVDSPTAFSSWRSICSFVDQGMGTVLAWDREQGPYARLYSRAHFAASHFAAAAYVLARPEVSWTAEFSDPLSHDVMGEERRAAATRTRLSMGLRDALARRGFQLPGDNVLEWAEVVPFALAERLIFTNAHQRDTMLEQCRDPRLADRAAQHAVVSPHPTLPERFYELEPSRYELDPDRRHIGYFGNFYANRGLELVLDALVASAPEVRDRLTLHVFTSAPAELASSRQARALGSSLRVGPYVDYLEFLNLCTRMDCLLVNDAVTPRGVSRNPFLPSKLSDYKGAGTPIWGIVEHGSVLAGEHLAWRSPVEHVSGAVQVLAQIAAAGRSEE